MRPLVAVVATGGTIASRGRDALDIQDYGASGLPMLDAAALVALVPELALVAEVLPVPFDTVPSTAMGFARWRALAETITQLEAAHPTLAGVVVTHGTSAMEETAYALDLGLAARVTVVLTGAQRPATAISSDGPMNLVNAVRVAAHPEARGLGVLVVMNDEVHAAREVTKASNGRLHAFRSPTWGPLGVADGDAVVLRRRPAPAGPRHDIGTMAAPPRVDILYAHADGDGVAVEAFLAAGARGIVAAGFGPGFVTPAEREALRGAIARGCTVVLSSRTGSGRVFRATRYAAQGFLSAEDLNPQKARIRLAFALAEADAAGAAAAFAQGTFGSA